MVDSKKNLRKYYLPVYYIWALISPTLILIIHNIPLKRYPAFYSLWGVIWPLSFVTYPAFLLAIQENNFSVKIGSFDIALVLFFIAWLGPVVHFIFAIKYHKKYLEKSLDQAISWSDYFFGFI